MTDIGIDYLDLSKIYTKPTPDNLVEDVGYPTGKESLPVGTAGEIPEEKNAEAAEICPDD
jgi:hypothetical protein